MNQDRVTKLTIKFLIYIRKHPAKPQAKVLKHLFPMFEGSDLEFITVVIPDLLYKKMIYDINNNGTVLYGITDKGKDYLESILLSVPTDYYDDTVLLDAMINHHWCCYNDNIPCLTYVMDINGEMVGNNHIDPRDAIIEAIEIVELNKILKVEDNDL